jgi:hypothetical protein
LGYVQDASLCYESASRVDYEIQMNFWDVVLGASIIRARQQRGKVRAELKSLQTKANLYEALGAQTVAFDELLAKGSRDPQVLGDPTLLAWRIYFQQHLATDDDVRNSIAAYTAAELKVAERGASAQTT